VLQCVAVCCSVLQCGAVCRSVLQCVALLESHCVCCSVLQCVAVCCSVVQCVAVCRSVLQCVALLELHSKETATQTEHLQCKSDSMYCNTLQLTATHCTTLQRIQLSHQLKICNVTVFSTPQICAART